MKAIFALYPEAVKTKYKSDTEMYAWDEDENKIELDLDAINNWVDPEAYKDKRKEEYPPMADYLDGIVKGDDAQVQKYIDDCLAVKAKYPKDSK